MWLQEIGLTRRGEKLRERLYIYSKRYACNEDMDNRDELNRRGEKKLRGVSNMK